MMILNYDIIHPTYVYVNGVLIIVSIDYENSSKQTKISSFSFCYFTNRFFLDLQY